MAFNWLKIKKVLIPQMEVVGLSISEDGIRLVSFKPNSYIIKSYQGVSFVPGVIEKGILKKPEVLQAAIASIKNKVWKKKEERFVVLSLPSQNFYTNIISMPDLPASEFENSIKLNTQMNSPLPIEQSYFDWQIINTNLGNNPDPNLKQVFVALSDKSCIDPYLAAIENEGIKTMATELEPFSTARLMSGLGCRGPYLYINLKRDGLYLYIFNNDIPVFSDYDSWAEVSGSNDGAPITFEAIKERLAIVIPRLLTFYSSRYNDTISRFYLATTSPLKAELTNLLQTNFQLAPLILKLPAVFNKLGDDWFGAIGSGLRSLIPRSNDVLISVSPYGTEEIFSKGQTINYLSFWIKIVAVFSFALLAVYLSLNYFFFQKEDLKFNDNLIASQQVTISARQAELTNKAREFNDLITQALLAKDFSKNWHEILGELFNLTDKNKVTIGRLFISPGSGQITMQASAANKETAATFKEALNKAQYFANVNMPLTSFSENAKEVIFTLNFNLR